MDPLGRYRLVFGHHDGRSRGKKREKSNYYWIKPRKWWKIWKIILNTELQRRSLQKSLKYAKKSKNEGKNAKDGKKSKKCKQNSKTSEKTKNWWKMQENDLKNAKNSERAWNWKNSKILTKKKHEKLVKWSKLRENSWKCANFLQPPYKCNISFKTNVPHMFPTLENDNDASGGYTYDVREYQLTLFETCFVKVII